MCVLRDFKRLNYGFSDFWLQSENYVFFFTSVGFFSIFPSTILLFELLLIKKVFKRFSDFFEVFFFIFLQRQQKGRFKFCKRLELWQCFLWFVSSESVTVRI